MHIQRGGVGVTTLDKYLYAVGGNDGTSSLDSCERYDPLLNKWKMTKPMCYRRRVCAADQFNVGTELELVFVSWMDISTH